MSAGAIVALIGSFLPWLRSGQRSRTSYELFQVADRLGFGDTGAAGWALRLWPLVPFATALVITLQWWHPTSLLRRLGATVLPALTAIAIGGIAMVLILAPSISLFRVGVGPMVTVLGGVLMLAGAVGGLVGRRA